METLKQNIIDNEKDCALETTLEVLAFLNILISISEETDIQDIQTLSEMFFKKVLILYTYIENTSLKPKREL